MYHGYNTITTLIAVSAVFRKHFKAFLWISTCYATHLMIMDIIWHSKLIMFWYLWKLTDCSKKVKLFINRQETAWMQLIFIGKHISEIWQMDFVFSYFYIIYYNEPSVFWARFFFPMIFERNNFSSDVDVQYSLK